MRLARALTAIVGVVTLTLAGACSGPAGPNGQSGLITIVASPSFTDAINAMVHAYTSSYPGVQINTTFVDDAHMPDRVKAGPTPDVVVAESPQTLTNATITGSPAHFALGQLVMAVPKDNPKALHGLDDLRRPDVRVALCAADEPCGEVATAVLAAAQVPLPANAVTKPDVRSALDAVTSGTADVALVYRFDAQAASDTFITVELPSSGVALADLVAIVPANAPNSATAHGFLDYLVSPAVADVLTRDGFRPTA